MIKEVKEGTRERGKDQIRPVQVARQGNPLFNEGLVAIVDKDRYSRTSPSDDRKRSFIEHASIRNSRF